MIKKKILLKIGVSPIDEKIWESHLGWFGHVHRRMINAPMRKSELIKYRERKGKGRPKIALLEVI